MASLYKVIPHLGTILGMIIYVQGSEEERLCVLQTLSYRNMNSPPLCIERLINYQVLIRSAENRCYSNNNAYKNMQSFETVRQKDNKCPEINQRSYNAINYACCNYANESYVPYQCTFWEDYQMSQKCNSITELERHRTNMRYSCHVRSYKHPKVTVPNLMVTNDGCLKDKYKLIKTACCIDAKYKRKISTLHPLTEKTTRQTWRTYTTSTTSTTWRSISRTTSTWSSPIWRIRSEHTYASRVSSTSTPLLTIHGRRSSTEKPNGTPTETEASSQISTDAAFGVAFVVLVCFILIGFTMYVVAKKRRDREERPVDINYSKHDFAVQRRDSEIMEPGHDTFRVIRSEQGFHPHDDNRSSHRSHRSTNQTYDEQLLSNCRPSRHDVERHGTNRSYSRHDIERYDTRRRPSRHDIDDYSTDRTESTRPQINPLEVLETIMNIGKKRPDKRSRKRKKRDDNGGIAETLQAFNNIASGTSIATRHDKSSKTSRSRRKSKRRRDDYEDTYA